MSVEPNNAALRPVTFRLTQPRRHDAPEQVLRHENGATRRRGERLRGRFADPRYGTEEFAAARDVLGRRFHPEAVADVVDVVTGYNSNGLRGTDGSFLPLVVVAVRAVAGRPCDEQLALALLLALEPLLTSDGAGDGQT